MVIWLYIDFLSEVFQISEILKNAVFGRWCIDGWGIVAVISTCIMLS